MPRGIRGFNKRDFQKIFNKRDFPELYNISAFAGCLIIGITLIIFGFFMSGLEIMELFYFTVTIGILFIFIGICIKLHNVIEEKKNAELVESETPLVNMDKINENENKKIDISKSYDFDLITENFVVDEDYKKNVFKFAKLNVEDEFNDYIYNGGHFDENTRIFRLDITQETEYRTIERYVQRNYERYPVYSDLKIKRKEIHKRIKLTNSNLENLNNYDDEIIREFCSNIIIELNNIELIPYWFYLKWVGEFYQYKLAVASKKIKNAEQQYIIDDTTIKNTIQKTKYSLECEEKYKNKVSRKFNKLNKKLQKRIIFFKKRKTQKYNILNEKISNSKKELDCLYSEISNMEKYKEDILKNKENYIQEIKSSNENLFKIYYKILKKLPHLETSFNETSDFKLLKNVMQFEYSKIIGCYIIRNRENQKCYVGQSKDVLRRLKQHFKGTTPTNIIFAEDYYLSKWDNREDLFEIKIIPLETKDELDTIEKSLIEEYEAFTKGYNGTNGNK